jgi:hypothetical protein
VSCRKSAKSPVASRGKYGGRYVRIGQQVIPDALVRSIEAVLESVGNPERSEVVQKMVFAGRRRFFFETGLMIVFRFHCDHSNPGGFGRLGNAA